MKKYLWIFLMIGGISFAKAECYYSKYHLKFEIQTPFKKAIYYDVIGACDFNIDSIQNSDYLIKVLQKEYFRDGCSLATERLFYKYCLEEENDCLASEKDSIAMLRNIAIVDIKDIKSIQVLEYIKVEVFDDLYTKIPDTILMREAPVEVLYCGGYLCYHQIFVYEKNSGVSEILSEVRMLQSEIEELRKTEDLNYNVGEAYDSMLDLLLSRLPLEKVALISGCTD